MKLMLKFVGGNFKREFDNSTVFKNSDQLKHIIEEELSNLCQARYDV